MTISVANNMYDYMEPAIDLQLPQVPVSFQMGLALREIEQYVILETLKRQKYNRTRTAKVLGIGIRTLQRKIKQYQEEGLPEGFSLNP